MEIKQLKLNGTAFYPKVGVDSIVNAAGEASAVDTVVTENSSNLITSGAVYDAIQEGGGGASVNVEVYDVTATGNWGYTDNGWLFLLFSGAAAFDMFDNFSNGYPKKPCLMKLTLVGGSILTLTPTYVKKDDSGPYYTIYLQATETDTQGLMTRSVLYTYAISIYNGDGTCYLYRKQVPIITDDALDANSANPVQNKVVNGAISSLSQSVVNKQDKLVSGTNIKTINNESLLGSGNIDIQGGGSGSVNSVSYSNYAGDFAPDANGKVTLTIDLALSADSGRPVTNAAISTKFNSVDTAVNNVNTTVTNMSASLVNHGNAITAIERVLWKDDENQIDKVNGRVDSLSSVVDSALTDIDDCVETIEISNNKLKYTTSGGVTPVDVATIDTVATKNSKNLVTSGAVLNSVGNSFDSKSKYFKGFGLSSVESVFDIHGQLIDPSVNTRVGYIELTIEWFNAKCDAGETDRLVKKHYVVGKELLLFDGNQWDPSGIISDINEYPGNGTDFSPYSQPSFTWTSSGGRIDVQIHLGLLSSKYQVHSITITKAYDPYNTELQITEAFLSTAQYLYHYTDDPQPGIYVIEGEVILRTNNNWYKIGDAEESPMKPNT